MNILFNDHVLGEMYIMFLCDKIEHIIWMKNE